MKHVVLAFAVVLIGLLAASYTAQAETDSTFTGWKLEKEGYYYYKDGQIVKGEGGLTWINGKYYFPDRETGLIKTGWLKDGGEWCWCKPTSGEAITGWKKRDGKWYYLNPYSVTSTIRSIDGKDYLFDQNGVWVTKLGWVSAKSLGFPERQVVAGVRNWYYVNTDGTVRYGWIKDNGKWYHTHRVNGTAMNIVREVDGKNYTFNANGEWVPN